MPSPDTTTLWERRMNPDELRNALQRENMESGIPEPEPIEDSDDLARLIRRTAKEIAAQFPGATGAGERYRLQERYKLLDRWLTELHEAESLGDAEYGAAKNKLRPVVLDELRKWKLGGGEEHRSRLQEIETGRKRLVERAKGGALQSAHKRIRDELEYLLKNYAPSNEYKIETLIDKWRTSGDPGYDPGIRLRLRNARRKKSENDQAF